MHNNCINELYVQEELFHLFRKIPKAEFIDGNYSHAFSDEYIWEKTINRVTDILELDLNTSIINVDPVGGKLINTNTPIIKLNSKYKNRLVSNVYKIEYNNLYPTIIMRMDRCDETASDISKLVSSIVKFRKSTKILMANKSIDQQSYDDYNTAQLNAKAFINYIYGKCNRSKYLMASFSISDYVRSEIAIMWGRIRGYLGDDIIYFDTDMAYVVSNNHNKDKIFKAFDSSLITYEFEVKPCVGFHRLKMVYEFPEKIPYFSINRTKITPINY